MVMVQVPQDVREARRDELVSLQQHVGQGFAQSLVGRQVFTFRRSQTTLICPPYDTMNESKESSHVPLACFAKTC